jgi:hypothetical protein
MKLRNTLLTALVALGLVMLTAQVTPAQTCDGTGKNFVDVNGDGFNDNAADHDGDGIPNGLDEDYIKNAKTGTGYQHQNGQAGANAVQAQTKAMTKSQRFNKLQAFSGNMYQKRIGAANSGGSGAGMCDGTGPKGGSGVCDGTGPKGGSQKGGGK